MSHQQTTSPMTTLFAIILIIIIIAAIIAIFVFAFNNDDCSGKRSKKCKRRKSKKCKKSKKSKKSRKSCDKSYDSDSEYSSSECSKTDCSKCDRKKSKCNDKIVKLDNSHNNESDTKDLFFGSTESCNSLEDDNEFSDNHVFKKSRDAKSYDAEKEHYFDNSSTHNSKSCDYQVDNKHSDPASFSSDFECDISSYNKYDN